FDCSSSSSSSSPQLLPSDLHWSLPSTDPASAASSAVTVDVTANPFALTIRDASGNALLETTPPPDNLDPADPLRAHAPLPFTHDEDTTVQAVMKGWDYFSGDDDPWKHATSVTSAAHDGDALVLHLATDDSAHASVTLRIEPGPAAAGPGVHLVARIDGA